MLRNLCSATSVLMVNSRPRSICESAELILPIALVIRFWASAIVVTEEDALRSTSALRASAAFFS